MFEIDEVTTGSRYEYDKNDPTKINLRSTDKSSFTRMVSLDDIKEMRRPVQSPLTKWNIWWDEDLVDVSNVERVRFEVAAEFRARSKFKKQESATAPVTAFRTWTNNIQELDADPVVLNAEGLPGPMDHIASIHDIKTSSHGSKDFLTDFAPQPIDPFVSFVKWPVTGGRSVNNILLKFEKFSTFKRSDRSSHVLSWLIDFIIPNGYSKQQAVDPQAFKSFDSLGSDPQ
jgi:hypothetical protein